MLANCYRRYFLASWTITRDGSLAPGQVAAGVGQSSILIYSLAIVHLYTPSLNSHVFKPRRSSVLRYLVILADSLLVLLSLLTLPEEWQPPSPQDFAFSVFLYETFIAKICTWLCCILYSGLCSNITSSIRLSLVILHKPHPTQLSLLNSLESPSWRLLLLWIFWLMSVSLFIEFKPHGIMDIAFCSLLYSFFLQR